MSRPAALLSRAVFSVTLLASTALTLAADDAHGHAALSPTPSPQEGIVTGITAIVVFLIVFAVLAVKVWPVISRSLDERADKIRTEIEAAEMAQKQAKAALEQYERNLADARAEAQKMLTDAVAQQQTLVAEQKAKAEVEIGQMRDRARRDIEAARRAAVEEVYAAAVGQATLMASKILRREMSANDQQRLVEESLAELQGLGRAT
jgi:F-type H+-transporting ATPase subunit b